MKFSTPEISWHNRDPVYSADFQCVQGSMRRLATCGTDQQIRIWNISINKDDTSEIEFLSTLSRHSRAVNVVRFSPDGEILASGADDNLILLWKLNPIPPTANLFQGEEEVGKENWSVFKQLRSHLEDVYDLSWSSDGLFLLSGSVDNSAILWDVKKGQKLWLFTEHKSFVQGVAFDPLSRYLATMSSDRICRIYQASNPYNLAHELKKVSTPSGKSIRMFCDDTMKSFFRRLSFSPDGLLLVAPAGCMENAQGDAINTVYIFARGRFTRPVLYYPVGNKPAISVRFCPTLFSLRRTSRKNQVVSDVQNNEENEDLKTHETIFALSYRMVFAVATENSVILYDTQQSRPFAYIANVHYHTLSDISWSSDGRVLVIASTDGYCTVVTFEDGELGTPYEKQVHQLVSAAESSSTTGNKKILGKETVSPVRESAKGSDRHDQCADEAEASVVRSLQNVNLEQPAAIPEPPKFSETVPSTSVVVDSPMETNQTNSTSPGSFGVPQLPSAANRPPRRVAVVTLGSDPLCSKEPEVVVAKPPRRIMPTMITNPTAFRTLDNENLPSNDLESAVKESRHPTPTLGTSEESLIEASNDLNLVLEISSDSDMGQPEPTTNQRQSRNKAPTEQPRRVMPVLLEPMDTSDNKPQQQKTENSSTTKVKQPGDAEPSAKGSTQENPCPRRVSFTTMEKFLSHGSKK